MEIQNISGPDVVPSGLTVEKSAAVETETQVREEEVRKEPPPEETRGQNIDTYA